jgi:predicted RNase H-like nuclease (RuvC/YqgF family)
MEVVMMVEWKWKGSVMMNSPRGPISEREVVDCKEAEEKLVEKDKELKDAGALINSLTTTTERQTKEIERLKGENTNMKKYINQRSDGGIPYPEVEPSFTKFKPSDK